MKLSLVLPAVFLALFTMHSTANADEAAVLGGILPSTLQDAKGVKVDTDSLKGKTVALYFSAHWCPPCRAFTPSLVKFRDKHANDDFEIVFISLDRSERDKKKYLKETNMKWLTVPGASSKAGEALAKRFQIRGIPALIVLAPDGSVITENGREDVMFAPETALQKWKETHRS